MTKDNQIIEIIAQLGLGELIHVSQLGGLTNRNYNVETADNNLVIRLPGKDTDKIINRSHEEKIVRAIADLNIDAPLIHFDTLTGVKVTQFIDGAKTMNAQLLQEQENRDQAARLLAHLHNASIKIDVEFDVMDMIFRYEKSLVELNGYFPEGYGYVKERIITYYNENHNSGIKKVLSHNDPLPENFIVSKDGNMYLVDWEYGGMNSPYWDLADVSIEANFTQDQDFYFMETYLGKAPKEKDYIQLQLNKLYIDLLWSLWGYIREALKEEHESVDFIEYGNDRFKRLCSNLKIMEKNFI